uniref:Uncharacterized protein n=1 Tax=Arundo donax TaxID=35708 RepID=A0A0A9C1N9_ARUDO
MILSIKNIFSRELMMFREIVATIPGRVTWPLGQ